MSDIQLLLSIAIASLLIVVGFIYNNSRLNTIETNVNVGFQDVRSRLIGIEGDLRQFYRDLGRHDAEIGTLKEQRRA
jgi:hypothetical protein